MEQDRPTERKIKIFSRYRTTNASISSKLRGWQFKVNFILRFSYFEFALGVGRPGLGRPWKPFHCYLVLFSLPLPPPYFWPSQIHSPPASSISFVAAGGISKQNKMPFRLDTKPYVFPASFWLNYSYFLMKMTVNGAQAYWLHNALRE